MELSKPDLQCFRQMVAYGSTCFCLSWLKDLPQSEGAYRETQYAKVAQQSVRTSESKGTRAMLLKVRLSSSRHLSHMYPLGPQVLEKRVKFGKWTDEHLKNQAERYLKSTKMHTDKVLKRCLDKLKAFKASKREIRNELGPTPGPASRSDTRGPTPSRTPTTHRLASNTRASERAVPPAELELSESTMAVTAPRRSMRLTSTPVICRAPADSVARRA
jgi:hypothetical protein